MKKNKDKIVSIALRNYAESMCNHPDLYSIEEGKALDRALRSCKEISDIDVVWVRWRYIAEKNNWLTDNEMQFSKSGYYYPNYDYND